MEKQIIDGSELAGKKFEVLEDGTLRMIETGKHIPNVGDEYYYLGSDGFSRRCIYEEDFRNCWIINHNPIFNTNRECQEYKRFIELLDKYKFEPNRKDGNQPNYHIYYDASAEKLCIEVCWGVKTREYSFESEKKAREFISKAGEHNIKRFMFDIWE